MNPSKLACLAAFTVASLSTLPANGLPIRVVSPSNYANTEAPSVVSDIPTNLRFQQVFPSSDFASLPADQRTITQLKFRPDGDLATSLAISIDRLTISLSTTSANPPNLDTIFTNNIGPDETVVFDGPVTVTTLNEGPAGGPKEFDYGVKFNTPFEFDPSAGNLLLDWRHEGISGAPFNDFLDDPSSETQQLRGTLASTEAVSEFGGGIVEFTFQVPEPASWTLLVISAFALLGRRTAFRSIQQL